MKKKIELNCSKMENNQKNIFESALDSFEFDDGFLMKVDLDLKEYKYNKENLSNKKKVKCKDKGKQDNSDGEKGKKMFDIKTHFYDSPLFIEDLDESQFFATVDKKKKSSKVVYSHNKEKAVKESYPCNFTSCLSPIDGSKSKNQMNLFSSTPVRFSDSNSKETVKQKEKSEYEYLEADLLFDDWNDVDTEKNSQRSTVTLSQALKLIEEAEAARNSDEEDALNQSIDLLTGEVIGEDVGAMFDESFGLPKSEKKDKKVSNESVIILDDCDVKNKPSAAQKLNFEEDHDIVVHERNICFESDDDDFDFLTQDLLKKTTKNSSSSSLFKINSPSSNSSEDNNLNDSIIQFRKKRGKCSNVIESDSTEDSPSPKIRRKNKSKERCQKNVGKEFIDSEAEVSDVVDVSSDEAVEEGEYDKSFLDEESYFTQNCSANMTSKYLESVKGVNRTGTFKIPAAKPYDPINIFSQIPEENNTDYEIDSFCVNEVEEEMNTDLSDLEVAEKILEMDRKKRKKKKFGNSKKLK